MVSTGCLGRASHFRDGPSQARSSMKRWQHWCVTDERFVLALTLADLGYLGLAALWWPAVASGKTRSTSALRRRMDLAAVAGRGLELRFDDGPAGTRLHARGA